MSAGVLAGLDEQQLEAVTTLRGPVVVLAGAGTGKTRVITHRIAHGVDTGAYSPGRVMAVTFTAKAAGEMRGRLRALGVEGVAARTFHAAALAQLNYFWPTLAGDTDARHRRQQGAPARARRRRHGHLARHRDAARRRERDRVAQGDDAQHRRVRRRAPERDRPTRRRSGSSTCSAPTRSSRTSGASSTSRTCCSRAPACSRPSRTSPVPCTSSTATSRSTSSRTSRRCSIGCSSCGSATGATCASSATRARRSTRSPAPTPASCSSSRAGTRTRGWCGCETNYRSDAAILAVANELMRDRPGRPAPRRPDARADAADELPTVTAFDDDEDEARGVAARIAQQIAAGIDPRRIAVLYRAHAQSAELVAALADVGHRGDGARRPSVLRPARGAPGGHGAARRVGRARSRAGSSTPCATCCARSG